jgi:dipeptidyl aminopeptidase/acylaminoacyl peptidase
MLESPLLRHVTAVALTLLGILPATQPVAATPPPLRLYGQLPNISGIRLSPSGDKWAAIMADDKVTQVQVRSSTDGSIMALSTMGEAKPRDLIWVDEDHLVVRVSSTEDLTIFYNGKGEWSQLLGLDLTKPKEWLPLMRGIPNVVPVTLSRPVAAVRDGKPVLVTQSLYLNEDHSSRALVDVDVSARGGLPGTVTASNMISRKGGFVVAKGNADTIDWMIGGDGRPLARVDYNQRSGVWDLWVRQGDQLKKVYSETALQDAPELVSFGHDAGTLLLSSHKSGAWEDYELHIADGNVVGPVAGYGGDRVILDPVSHIVIGTKDTNLADVTHDFVAPADKALWRQLQKAFPGHQVELVDWNADRSRIVVEVFGPQHGNAQFLVDRQRKTAGMLAPTYAGLGPEQLSPVTTLTYKASDGMDIPAYLTLPRDRPAKALPLIVMPHGGPAARDYPGFDWWAQALASRGYAVLQPQFRGSLGFGEAHLTAGYGQWGRKMQTDLSDGVKHLAANGIIDPKRVCIAGASYGGYAAMAGVTLDQGVYRCASAVAGVSDLRRMLVSEKRDTGSGNNGVLRFWQRFMGAEYVGDTAIDAWSPARLAAKVTVPLQLIHGKDDTVVPIEQSRLMQDAMKDAGKSVDWVELAGEDHWLSRPATRIAMLEAQIAFLEKHNPPN